MKNYNRLFDENENENAPIIFTSKVSKVDKSKVRPLTEKQRGLADEINSMLDERAFVRPNRED